MRACYFLSYDIPEWSGLRNPSHRLHGRAVRVNGSDWVVVEDDVPWGLLDELGRGGATWHLVPFDPGGEDALLRMVLAGLRKEADGLLDRARRSAHAADLALSDRGDHAAYRRAATRIRARAERLAAALRRAASAFGLDGAAFGLADAAGVVAVLAVGMTERAARYAALARQAAARNSPLAAAAATSDVPPLVLADAVEEAGGDAAAAREVFTARVS